MEILTVKEILPAMSGSLTWGKRETVIKGVSTDTRTLKEGELFFALPGEHFDGHKFVREAMKKGAPAVVINQGRKLGIRNANFVLIEVVNTLNALQDLARYYRHKFNIPVIAITGSNGKTTTKEILFNILSKKYFTLKPQASYNNEVGLPLTLLNLSQKHEVVIVEMGMNAPGEIGKLTQIAHPSFAIITNIGEAHLGYLGSCGKIALAKEEVFSLLKKEDKAILNADDSLVMKMKEKIKAQIITYGIKEKADFQATAVKNLGEEGIEFILNGETKLTLSMAGEYNIYNALASIATAQILGLNLDLIKESLKDFKGVPMRMEIISLPWDSGKIKIVNDAYNANPTSMRDSLLSWQKSSKGVRKIVVLGDMLELGEYSFSAHKTLGEFVGKLGIDILLTVGNFTKITARSALENGLSMNKVFVCQNNQEVVNNLLKVIQSDDTIFIKGSRKMGMEEIVKGLASGFQKIEEEQNSNRNFLGVV